MLKLSMISESYVEIVNKNLNRNVLALDLIVGPNSYNKYKRKIDSCY